jgi:hypothetical protein
MVTETYSLYSWWSLSIARAVSPSRKTSCHICHRLETAANRGPGTDARGWNHHRHVKVCSNRAIKIVPVAYNSKLGERVMESKVLPRYPANMLLDEWSVHNFEAQGLRLGWAGTFYWVMAKLSVWILFNPTENVHDPCVLSLRICRMLTSGLQVNMDHITIVHERPARYGHLSTSAYSNHQLHLDSVVNMKWEKDLILENMTLLP